MVFKINVSHQGKTAKFEIESEEIVGKIIGDKIGGGLIDAGLEGYELEISGTSDKAGFPGLPDVKGAGLKKKLLIYGAGLHKRPKGIKKIGDKPKGLRYRKTIRGNEISEDTVQINIKVLKEGGKKFEDLLPKKEETPKEGEAPKEEAKVEEKPVEEKKEEAPAPTRDSLQDSDKNLSGANLSEPEDNKKDSSGSAESSKNN